MLSKWHFNECWITRKIRAEKLLLQFFSTFLLREAAARNTCRQSDCSSIWDLFRSNCMAQAGPVQRMRFARKTISFIHGYKPRQFEGLTRSPHVQGQIAIINSASQVHTLSEESFLLSYMSSNINSIWATKRKALRFMRKIFPKCTIKGSEYYQILPAEVKMAELIKAHSKRFYWLIRHY